MSDKMKFIIDMDIGDEIDDAIALYAAMRQNFEIIGITTVFQNTKDRARQAKKLLQAYGNGYESVPVYAGYGTPIGEKEQAWPHIPHYTPDMEQDRYAPDGINPEDAVDFIIDACYKYGKNLTVVAIGPFTNLAKVIEKDACALNLIAKVAIMGGAFYKQYADWNVMCDVTAADLTFRTLTNLECIGADVTHLTRAEDRLYENLLYYQGSEKGHQYLSKLCQLWRADPSKSELLLHDPLVIYHLTHKGLCKTREASVVVMTDGYARGLTFNVDAYSKKHLNREVYTDFDDAHKTLVAYAVDLETFNNLIFNDFDV